MLKKAIRIFVSLSFILSISAFAAINVSAATVVTAGTSTYEIAQDFEAITAGTTLTSANNATQETAGIMEGPGAISGEKSLQINVIAPGGYSKIDLAASLLPAPTMTKPDGVFFRVEFDKPVEGPTSTGATMITTLDGSYDGMQTAWVTDTAGGNGYFGTYAGFKGMIIGYIFVPFPNAVWADPNILGWDMRSTLPANSKMLLDDLGYYTGTDYVSIINSLNTASPLNPVSLQGVTTNTYKGNVIVNNPVQMVVNAYHKGASEIVWSVSDTSVATIDEAGLLMPKKRGTVTVTATLSGTEVSQSVTAGVLLGDIDLTSQELDNATSAVFGIKVKFRAAPRYCTPDTTIVWSVKSGPATIVDAELDLAGNDADLVGRPDVTCVLASFTDSGRVVIRAALGANPAIFTDYTLDIMPSLIGLQEDILTALGMNPSAYTSASWDKMMSVVDEANALIDKGAEMTTQSAVNAMQQKLSDTVKMMEAGSPDDENPQTGSDSLPLTALSLSVIMLGAIVVVLKKKVFNKQ